MPTLSQLKDKLEPFKDTLVIADFDRVVRLVDVIEDEDDDDFYWVYDSSTGIIHSSCVCDWIPLKGFLSDKNYNTMVHVWNLNNSNKAI
jgi:hypothetical protein